MPFELDTTCFVFLSPPPLFHSSLRLSICVPFFSFNIVHTCSFCIDMVCPGMVDTGAWVHFSWTWRWREFSFLSRTCMLEFFVYIHVEGVLFLVYDI